MIINRGGGSFGEDSAEKLQPLFEKNGIDAKILAVDPGELDRHCTEAAAAAGIDALVAAGGDGTISTAAAAVAGTEMPLGVLPLGTLNHFAKDAGIPLDLEEAVAAIAGGRTRQVDVAEVNGRVFINNSAVGLYPELVKSREAQQRLFGRGKKAAMLVAGVRAFWRFSRRRLTIRIAGHQGTIVTPLLFVGNNRYKMDLLDLGQRDAIDRGELCLYAPLAGGPFHFLSVSVRAVLGREDRQSDFLAIDGVREVEIDSPRAALMVATDGEAQTLDTPLRYKVRPGALKLIVPRSQAASERRNTAGP
ncbi:MAG TPA: diacylglycerol kinase family protein [Allosphingosinicella sp.]|nr:diacylglycerol kinase family protein [Allosphingosinicella sp.]